MKISNHYHQQCVTFSIRSQRVETFWRRHVQNPGVGEEMRSWTTSWEGLSVISMKIIQPSPLIKSTANYGVVVPTSHTLNAPLGQLLFLEKLEDAPAERMKDYRRHFANWLLNETNLCTPTKQECIFILLEHEDLQFVLSTGDGEKYHFVSGYFQWPWTFLPPDPKLSNSSYRMFPPSAQDIKLSRYIEQANGWLRWPALLTPTFMQFNLLLLQPDSEKCNCIFLPVFKMRLSLLLC